MQCRKHATGSTSTEEAGPNGRHGGAVHVRKNCNSQKLSLALVVPMRIPPSPALLALLAALACAGPVWAQINSALAVPPLPTPLRGPCPPCQSLIVTWRPRRAGSKGRPAPPQGSSPFFNPRCMCVCTRTGGRPLLELVWRRAVCCANGFELLLLLPVTDCVLPVPPFNRQLLRRFLRLCGRAA